MPGILSLVLPRKGANEWQEGDVLDVLLVHAAAADPGAPQARIPFHNPYRPATGLWKAAAKSWMSPLIPPLFI
jgi:hypothetical protein